MANNLTNLPKELGQRAAGQSNRPTPFKEAFRKLGGGGRAQEAFIGGKQQRLKKVGDIARQKGIARGVQAKEALTQRGAQFGKELQFQQEEYQTARRQAFEDLNVYIQEKMRERKRYLDALVRRKEAMRKNLQGQLDEVSLAREMEGIDQLIRSGSTLFMSALPKMQEGLASRRGDGFYSLISPEQSAKLRESPYVTLEQKLGLQLKERLRPKSPFVQTFYSSLKPIDFAGTSFQEPQLPRR